MPGVFMFVIGGLGVIGNILSIFVLLRKVCIKPKLLNGFHDDILGQDLFQFSPGGPQHFRHISHLFCAFGCCQEQPWGLLSRCSPQHISILSLSSIQVRVKRDTSFTCINVKLRKLLRFDLHPSPDNLTIIWPSPDPYLTMIRRFYTSPEIHLIFTWTSPDHHVTFLTLT